MLDRDYRMQLGAELKRRQMVNPRYSLRAFSKSLGLSAPFISKVLSGQKNLSVEAAASISERLGFSPSEATQFCQLVQLQSMKTNQAREMLSGTEDSTEFNTVQLDVFQMMSDWYHYAILELATCRGFRSESRYVADQLGISIEAARDAVARLLRLGLLMQKNGHWIKAEKFLATPTDQPSRALRNFHSQMIEKAGQALEKDPTEKRDITGITLSIKADQLEQAKEEIRKFRRRLAKLMDTNQANQVYQLNVQFFALSDKTDKERA